MIKLRYPVELVWQIVYIIHEHYISEKYKTSQELFKDVDEMLEKVFTIEVKTNGYH